MHCYPSALPTNPRTIFPVTIYSPFQDWLFLWWLSLLVPPRIPVSYTHLLQTLPQKEFYLLYKLLSYPGKIFTRIQLMDEIWGKMCIRDRDTVPSKGSSEAA